MRNSVVNLYVVLFLLIRVHLEHIWIAMYLNNNGNNNTKMITAPSSSSASFWWWWWRWSTENKRRKAAAAATTMIVCLCARENKNHQQHEEFNSEKFHSRARALIHSLSSIAENVFFACFSCHTRNGFGSLAFLFQLFYWLDVVILWFVLFLFSKAFAHGSLSESMCVCVAVYVLAYRSHRVCLCV